MATTPNAFFSDAVNHTDLSALIANMPHGMDFDRLIDGTADPAGQHLVGDKFDDVIVLGAGDTVGKGGAGYDIVVNTNPDGHLTLGKDIEAGAVGDITGDPNLARLDTSSTFAGDITGNAHANNLIGNDGDNQLDGKGGADVLVGNGGQDTLLGGGGNDTVSGGAGEDTILGGGGRDQLAGGGGDDSIAGGAGGDTITGGGGKDTLLGDAGNDSIAGGAGEDIAHGGSGNDILAGMGGDDQLFGDAGNDTLFGNAGDDTLNGGGGHDQLFGGAGQNAFQIDGGGSGNLAMASADDQQLASSLQDDHGRGNDKGNDDDQGNNGNHGDHGDHGGGGDLAQIMDFDPNNDVIDLSETGTRTMDDLRFASDHDGGSIVTTSDGTKFQVVGFDPDDLEHHPEYFTFSA